MSKQKRQQGDMHRFNSLSEGLHKGLSGALSNMRLSLTFRIALHYCWQLMRTSIAACLAVTVFYAGAQVPQLQEDLRYYAVQTYQEDGFPAGDVMRRADIDARWYAHAPEDVELLARLFSSPPVLNMTADHVDGGVVVVSVDLSQRLTVWGWLMLGVIFCDLWRMLGFIRKRNRLDRRVLAPIRDITDMAATLSASNLSNRINIAGTKNELKDLAAVINTMLDRIERSYNSQKQFVSDASHELRTPIAVIQGYVNMLDRWGKDDRTVLEEGIAAIAQETASMKELVESLLFLARHDKKTLMMEMEQFDLYEVAAELKREAEMVTPENVFLMEPAHHCVIEADRGMIKQVMRILCDNAVKYSPHGGTIRIGVEDAGHNCILTMTDHGSGIKAEELPKIFDRFFRSDSARKAESGGHGLGLSIARIIILAHGGKISVRSKVGEGTTFSILLPKKQTSAHTTEKTA